LKALRLTTIGQPLKAQEIPVPVVGPGEVLVQIKAAGICHSDAHYRGGVSYAGPLPVTLGHEIAGEVSAVGPGVTRAQPGNRVCLHYLVTCGQCEYCNRGQEQFCVAGQMLGKHRDGGYAEYIAVPERGVVHLPAEIPYEHAAIMMCSSSTSLHALRKARLQPGETVAVFGAGGLGMSAIQLARGLGALAVYAVDINADKLKLAASFGALPVDASQGDPVAEIRRLTGGRGVDVAVELIGLPLTMRQAVQSLGVMGRASLAGITQTPFEVDSYRELIGREAEIIGCSDHLLQEFPLLMEFARRKVLDLAHVVTRTVPLDAGPVNAALDALQKFGGEVRTVIVPYADPAGGLPV
jgi:D-arabinose 1-dehydrogenase-like Zn-dependent alcohol dehydrogenase